MNLSADGGWCYVCGKRRSDCHHSSTANLQDEISSLKAENERYRKALGQIENAGNTLSTNEVPYPLRVDVQALKSIAREALKDKQGGE